MWWQSANLLSSSRTPSLVPTQYSIHTNNKSSRSSKLYITFCLPSAPSQTFGHKNGSRGRHLYSVRYRFSLLGTLSLRRVRQVIVFPRLSNWQVLLLAACHFKRWITTFVWTLLSGNLAPAIEITSIETERIVVFVVEEAHDKSNR